MTAVTLRKADGSDAGTVDLDDALFGIEPNEAVMHQVVTAQLAARRAGTHSTKTRAERRGGGAKPWRQKGTGRARAGSSRSPIWRGGGVTHGPKPRDYAQKTPRKMKRLALRSALSDRAADDKVVVLDSWGIDEPKTKSAVAALDALGLDGRVLVILPATEEATRKSLRNLEQVHVCEPAELNTYDVLVSDFVVFTKDSLPVASGDSVGTLRETGGSKAATKKAPAKAAPAKKAAAAPGEAPTAGDVVAESKAAASGKVVKKVVKKKIVKKVVKKAPPKAEEPTEDES